MLGISDQVDRGSLVEEGIKAVEEGNTSLGLRLLNQLGTAEKSPVVLSYLAYCLAAEQHAYSKSLELTSNALQSDRFHPLIYLNLARIYLVAGRENKAMQTLRRGIRCQRHPLLLRKLESLSDRRRMVFPFLGRSNPLNVVSGKILAKFS